MRIPSLTILKRRLQCQFWQILLLGFGVVLLIKTNTLSVHLGGVTVRVGASNIDDREIAARGIVLAKRPPPPTAPPSISFANYLRMIHQNDTVELRPREVYSGSPGADVDHMHGVLGYRMDGSPGYVPRNYVPIAQETDEQKKVAHNPNCFNLFRSDSLPLSNPVPDVRNEKCKLKVYPNLVPVSVVMVFYNEPLSPLLRSITSVLDRTPPELLKEIILVDDGSDRDYTQEPLERYLRLLPKVTLRRMPVRQGLMATRVEGARIASAEIVVFLDSHIECNHGWLQPMVYRILQDYRNVVAPVIDSIDPDTMEYHEGGLDILAFDWGLRQAFPKRELHETEPTASPGMGGGLFAMNRTLFFDLGGYDPEMKLYGGEEVELPMRVWQCGNRLECCPCSHVGHIFRSGKYHKGQVYPVPGHVITKNHLRAAKMWMEPKYYKLVEKANGKLPPGEEIGDISWGTKIKEKFKCKNFQWFLDNVYPEMFIPGDPKFVRKTGFFRNSDSGLCLDSLGRSQDDAELGIYQCHSDKKNDQTQTMILTTGDEIRIGTGMYKMCLDRANRVDGVRMWGCHGGKGNQEWHFDDATGQLRDTGQSCLDAWTDDQGKHALRMSPCSSAASMKWVLDEVPVEPLE